MSLDYEALCEAAQLVSQRCRKLSSVRVDAVDARTSVDFESANCRDQQEYLRIAQRALLERLSGMVHDLTQHRNDTNNTELEKIQRLDRQLWEYYDYTEKSIAKLRSEELKLSRIDLKAKHRENRLRTACKDLIQIVEPLTQYATDETASAEDETDTVQSRAELFAEPTDAMHPKVRENHRALSHREMLLEQLQDATEEYEEQTLSRSLLEDQGEEPTTADLELEAQLRADVQKNVDLCNESYETIKGLRKQCLELGLSFPDIATEDQIEHLVGSETQSASPMPVSPSLSGLGANVRHTSPPGSVADSASSGMHGKTTEPRSTGSFSIRKSTHEQEQKDEAIRQWVDITHDRATEGAIEQVRQPPFPIADIECAINGPGVSQERDKETTRRSGTDAPEPTGVHNRPEPAVVFSGASRYQLAPHSFSKSETDLQGSDEG